MTYVVHREFDYQDLSANGGPGRKHTDGVMTRMPGLLHIEMWGGEVVFVVMYMATQSGTMQILFAKSLCGEPLKHYSFEFCESEDGSLAEFMDESMTEISALISSIGGQSRITEESRANIRELIEEMLFRSNGQ